MKRSGGLKRTGFRRWNHALIRAKPVTIGDRHFPSKAEAARWLFLETLLRCGAISELKYQDRVVLLAGRAADGLPEIAWRTDASYIESGRRVWEDTKPRPFTEREHLLVDLWRHFGPGLLRIVEPTSAGNWKTRMTIMGRAG